jgi:thioredoxin reductase
MFRRFPFFQRLLSWTKPYAPCARDIREYERYDWNSLIGDEPEHRALVTGFMDGTSYFPSRAEMEQGLVAFAERGDVQVRYECRWEGTARIEEGFELETSDGRYSAEILIFAIGMTEKWSPATIPGIELAPHYADMKQPEQYADKRVFIIGKRNSGFEVADGLLPWARQIILASPRPARISLLTHSTAGARARYMQPFEDHVLGGGVLIVDAAIEQVARSNGGYEVLAKGTTVPGEWRLEMDEVIVCTGFTTPLGDLPDLGVALFHQNRLPAQTPYWESPSALGIFFAGSVMQGSVGLKKYGNPGSSAAVHGFRHNAAVLARHLAETRFGKKIERPNVPSDDVVDLLLHEVTAGPEVWHQQSYLARALLKDDAGGIVDDGIVPLQHFIDAGGPDGVAVTVETNDQGEIRPAVYVRRRGEIGENLLPTNAMLDFATVAHREELANILDGVIT